MKTLCSLEAGADGFDVGLQEGLAVNFSVVESGCSARCDGFDPRNQFCNWCNTAMVLSGGVKKNALRLLWLAVPSSSSHALTPGARGVCIAKLVAARSYDDDAQSDLGPGARPVVIKVSIGHKSDQANSRVTCTKTKSYG